MEDLLPGEDDPRRQAVRAWIAAHPGATARELAESGYVAPHWPAPWGLDADPVHQLLIDDEFARAGVKRPSNQIGIGWAAPTIIHAGTEEQKKRYVLPALAGEEIWCQLFSEPGAGSDLASLGTRAVRDGDEWVVNGQKIWTTGAHYSAFGILIARTDPAAPKHRGITYFICPMDLPGIEVRNIRNIAGADSFNEVFFTDVRIPHANVVGEVNDGWRLAKVTLGNERVSLSSSGVLWGAGPTAADIVDEARRLGVTDAVMRQRLAALWTEHVILDLIRMRTLTARLRGEQPGPEASIRKIMADEHGQRAMEIARDLIGMDALLVGSREGQKTLRSRSWYSGYMFSKALTIGGGTGEVQRNILGERVLGLPAEPDDSTGRPWSETMRNATRGSR
ncbi:MAG: acyl-CoA dehydrogenase family protein [Actinomycetes bacterium]|jgi:alkylation response protein AidB-like acyl-CoA dehydrogenase